MARNINLATMNAETINALSSYYQAYRTASDVRACLKKAVEDAEQQVEQAKSARQALIDGGMPVDQAVLQVNVQAWNDALTLAEDKKKEGERDLRLAMAKATKLVPDSLFEGYQNRKTDRAAFIVSVREFLLELGLSGTDRGVEKIGEGISDWLMGGKSASGKSKKEGHLLGDWTKNTFKDRVIRAFLEFAIWEKGVFDVQDDYTLSLHDFSANDNSADENSADENSADDQAQQEENKDAVAE